MDCDLQLWSMCDFGQAVGQSLVTAARDDVFTGVLEFGDGDAARSIKVDPAKSGSGTDVTHAHESQSQESA